MTGGVTGGAETLGPTGPVEEALGALETERRNEAHSDLDLWAVRDIVAAMNALDAGVVEAVGACTDEITAAIELIVAGQRAGGRLIYAGAGTAGRLGVLDAAECGPTFSVAPDRVQAVVAGGMDAVTAPVEAAEDDHGAGAEEMATLGVGPQDVVVGISASGRTPFVLGAVEAARARGAATVGLTSNEGSALSAMADVGIDIATGPELIAGSTRLKAGTAQKLVLNMLSTISMIRLGRTYGNLMVDVRVSNDKLRTRAAGIVSEITGASPADALGALEAAGGRAKVATVMIAGGLDADGAAELLNAHDGHLRAALADERGDRQP
ncbi:N-acetylmuramic acid 6-phosphate etherase [Candidatus Poriferisocius sp.]|uniref:N-acetylmuramic acid 6-phosphate etherase n=1 Tax=Candidatus Poriferisocius sp. TaxID=3101276 RepID=UPI003B5B6299